MTRCNFPNCRCPDFGQGRVLCSAEDRLKVPEPAKELDMGDQIMAVLRSSPDGCLASEIVEETGLNLTECVCWLFDAVMTPSSAVNVRFELKTPTGGILLDPEKCMLWLLGRTPVSHPISGVQLNPNDINVVYYLKEKV